MGGWLDFCPLHENIKAESKIRYVKYFIVEYLML